MKSWLAQLRGAGLFGKAGVQRMLELTAGQPLMLHREPNNDNDRNAVRLTDLFGIDVGYVDRHVAAQIAPLLDGGFILMCKVKSPCIPIKPWQHARILIWLGGERTSITVQARLKQRKKEHERL